MESESRMENEWEKKCIKVKINRIINLCSSVRPAEEHENRKKIMEISGEVFTSDFVGSCKLLSCFFRLLTN